MTSARERAGPASAWPSSPARYVASVHLALSGWTCHDVSEGTARQLWLRCSLLTLWLGSMDILLNRRRRWCWLRPLWRHVRQASLLLISWACMPGVYSRPCYCMISRLRLKQSKHVPCLSQSVVSACGETTLSAATLEVAELVERLRKCTDECVGGAEWIMMTHQTRRCAPLCHLTPLASASCLLQYASNEASWQVYTAH